MIHLILRTIRARSFDDAKCPFVDFFRAFIDALNAEGYVCSHLTSMRMRVFFLLLLSAIGMQASGQVNMIQNGEAEIFANGTCPPTNVYQTGSTPGGGGWTIERGTPDHLCSYTGGPFGAEAPHLFRADAAHHGKGYFLLFGAASSGLPEAFRYTLATPLRSGVGYTFSFWGKDPVAFGDGTFMLKGASGAIYATQPLTDVTTWTSYAFTFTPIADEPYLILTTSSGSAGVAIDDLFLAPTSPLSLHIRWFDGEVEGKDAVLEWEMTEEHSLESFSIERSLDGRGFQRVGLYSATDDFNTRYTLTDTAVPAGRALYYRLRVLELNGSSRYSRTLSLRRAPDVPLPLSLSPNPARSTLRVSGFYEPGSIRIFSADGRLIMTKELAYEGEIIDIGALPAGVYFLQCRSAGATAVQRFVKE